MRALRFIQAFGVIAVLTFAGNGFESRAQSQPVAITVTLNQEGKPISPDLFGIFFEDINYAADGGLYAELVQNRSFEYAPTEQSGWNPLTAWELVQLDGGKGALKIADAVPVHPNNPHYAVVEIQQSGGGVGLVNSGFDGIALQAGEQYDFSLFARQLFTGNRWGGRGELESAAKLIIRLINGVADVTCPVGSTLSRRFVLLRGGNSEKPLLIPHKRTDLYW